ncbi:lipase [Devosia sp. PTR5]|uniref:Lipase n=1 Tax=Devosia oryzisoli TaxID=2774138 RepID=A0A927FU73_9HYPH|nr:SGNH/GDSL hydrolase family protein [Devosia oryzisoli]MBD8064978.1 lipase [Devosia oryzisoli]
MTRLSWASKPVATALVHGASHFERTAAGLVVHRVPEWARRQAADPQLNLVESQPAGVRLAFDTEATTIALEAIATRRSYVGAPPTAPGVYDLLVNGELAGQASLGGGRTLVIDMMNGTSRLEDGPADTLVFDLPRGAKRVELWLPHNEQVEVLGLAADAPPHPVAAPVARRWLHHGSSISHGSNAAHPTGIWPAVAAARAGLHLTNLGLGGSAMVDPFMARMIRDMPADLISLKLGINVVNGDMMSRRSFRTAVHGFLDTIRDGHATTPIVLVSPIYCPIHEETPGPAAPDFEAFARGEVRFVAAGDPASTARGKLALRQVREELEHIVAVRGDGRLLYLDGLSLYGPEDEVTLPLPDNLHPDAATHRLMGERFATHPVTEAALGMMGWR